MTIRLKIGTWIETTPREVTEFTSYAADWIEHRVVPGEYELFLTFKGGYLIPMPDDVTAKVATNVVRGELYSGFGGVNFAVESPRLGPSCRHLGGYAYQLPGFVETGFARLDPGMEWTLRPMDHIKEQGWDWDDLRRLGAFSA